MASSPEVRAQCGNPARWDPWRGLWVTIISTPTFRPNHGVSTKPGQLQIAQVPGASCFTADPAGPVNPPRSPRVRRLRSRPRRGVRPARSRAAAVGNLAVGSADQGSPGRAFGARHLRGSAYGLWLTPCATSPQQAIPSRARPTVPGRSARHLPAPAVPPRRCPGVVTELDRGRVHPKDLMLRRDRSQDPVRADVSYREPLTQLSEWDDLARELGAKSVPATEMRTAVAGARVAFVIRRLELEAEDNRASAAPAPRGPFSPSRVG